MKIINAPQGSAEWLAARAKCFTASEAPAMMGASKYQTRTELLRQKHTGIAAEVDENTQRLFDRGHASEASARSIVEDIIGDDLSPLTGSLEVDGLPLLASFDGLTQGRDIVWESKLFNAGLAEQVRAGELEPHYFWQIEQQLLVSGAERAYFTTTDGTPENTIGMWYESVPERRARLIAGWKQFADDLANYQHVEQTVAAVAEPVEALPVLSIQVNGQIALTHNLERFGKRMNEYIAGLPTKPETDQDFANLDRAVKELKKAEDALDSEETRALSQASAIADMRNLVAMYRETARTNRLMFEKIVKAEKENRKSEIVSNAALELQAYVDKLNERIGGKWMPGTLCTAARFAEVIKGLKSIDSMRDKVSTALANAKIEANEIADRIEANRKSLEAGNGAGLDYFFLVPDFASVCTKARDDFDALVTSRLAAHREREAEKAEAAKKAEEARIAAAVEAERKAGEARAAEAEAERIRKEEAEREADERAAEIAREDKNLADIQAADDQRGKADAGSNASGEVGDVGSIPQPVAASTPPIQFAKEPLGAPIPDAAMIDDFIRLLSIGVVEKKALRPHLLAWEKYRVAREMQVAA